MLQGGATCVHVPGSLGYVLRDVRVDIPNRWMGSGNEDMLGTGINSWGDAYLDSEIK